MKETSLHSLFKVKMLLSGGASTFPKPAIRTIFITAECEGIIFYQCLDDGKWVN